MPKAEQLSIKASIEEKCFLSKVSETEGVIGPGSLLVSIFI